MDKGNIAVSRDGESVIIKIAGEFDMTLTPDLNRHCNSIARDDTIKKIVIDFENVTRIDTSAFACMVNFMQEHAKEGIGVVVCNLSNLHKNYIEILKLSKIIKII